MPLPVSRRTFLQALAAQGAPMVAAAVAAPPPEIPVDPATESWILGKMSGAQALCRALLLERCGCVFGIPGAHENELWDTFKSMCVPYLLVTHEFSAAAMADGYARATGRVGVLCVVPGPGLTNAISGLGEALLDGIPVVCIVGDVARGAKYHPFQVHDLPQADLLRAVTKQVYEARSAADIPLLARQAFATARAGEPGPVGLVIPYDLFVEVQHFQVPPIAPEPLPFDEGAFAQALELLSCHDLRVGLYVGQGCMEHGDQVARLAETLHAPVATTVSGKGVIADDHPLAVGWGYGKQGTHTAQQVFERVDLLLAIGARFSELATAFYNIPAIRHSIQVDINARNLGAVIQPDVRVHADAGVFCHRLLEKEEKIRRSDDGKLIPWIRRLRGEDRQRYAAPVARHGADALALLRCLRVAASPDALVYMDVSMVEHWAAETFPVWAPRTYFNPTDNQAMGWSIPAALGGQKAFPGRQTIVVIGDGCFLMSGMELSTAAREQLPIKVFVLDDQAYGYMQRLQRAAYDRTTATHLAAIDYAAFAKAMGLAYSEITCTGHLARGVVHALAHTAPILTRVIVDYGKRPVRWIDAVRERYIQELTTTQKMRFLRRLSGRKLDLSDEND